MTLLARESKQSACRTLSTAFPAPERRKSKPGARVQSFCNTFFQLNSYQSFSLSLLRYNVGTRTMTVTAYLGRFDVPQKTRSHRSDLPRDHPFGKSLNLYLDAISRSSYAAVFMCRGISSRCLSRCCVSEVPAMLHRPCFSASSNFPPNSSRPFKRLFKLPQISSKLTSDLKSPLKRLGVFGRIFEDHNSGA